MNFVVLWNYNIKEKKIIPVMDNLIGTTVRFRNNKTDRNKSYRHHSPAHTIVKELNEKSELFSGTPLYADILSKDECKEKGFDRFLTFKIKILYTFDSDYEEVVCAYVTLHIEPCKVEPKISGGISEGSKITGYDITYLNGNNGDTIHDLMCTELEYYYKWLYAQIIEEYEREVKTTLREYEDSEEMIEELKRLCCDLEYNVNMAKKLLYLI